jgi:hypothetical protein
MTVGDNLRRDLGTFVRLEIQPGRRDAHSADSAIPARPPHVPAWRVLLYDWCEGSST